jgi:type IV fimbrial biogenesis protein FimT
MARQSGLTLIELMIAIAILAIIAGIAVPELRSIVINSRLTTQTNEVVAALNYARSEAIKRGADVVLCATDGANLGNGWFVNAGGACNAAQALVRHEALSEVFVDLTVESNRAALRAPPLLFNSRGALVGGARSVWIQANECPTGMQRTREISVLGSGRIATRRADCP